MIDIFYCGDWSVSFYLYAYKHTHTHKLTTSMQFQFILSNQRKTNAIHIECYDYKAFHLFIVAK